jgi:hypothetical protein
MYLGGRLEVQPLTPRTKEITSCCDDWNAQPNRLYSIKDSNILKISNKNSERGFDDEDRLYDFKEVYSIDQKFPVHPVLRKRKIVQVYALASIKIALNLGITHKLELKERQVIHSLEGLQVANSKTHRSIPAHRNTSFKPHLWSRPDRHA